MLPKYNVLQAAKATLLPPIVGMGARWRGGSDC